MTFFKASSTVDDFEYILQIIWYIIKRGDGILREISLHFWV